MITSGKITHIGFSDESHWSGSWRYRSLALVSLPTSSRQGVESKIQAILTNSEVTEFKWTKLRSADFRFLADKLIKAMVSFARARTIRIDVVIWDTHDRRHDITGRDDARNLARMHYHLTTNVIGYRWPADCCWAICPDRHTDMNWDTLEECLGYSSRRTRNSGVQRSLADQEESNGTKPIVTEVISSSEPVVQIADLFAGLAAFSWNERKQYDQWKMDQLGQGEMFVDDATARLSNSQKYKACVLREFESLCSRNHLTTGVRKGEGLRTRNPANQINFWLYVPQAAEDKAPTRGER